MGGIKFWQSVTYRGKAGVYLVRCGLDGRAARAWEYAGWRLDTCCRTCLIKPLVWIPLVLDCIVVWSKTIS